MPGGAREGYEWNMSLSERGGQPGLRQVFGQLWACIDRLKRRERPKRSGLGSPYQVVKAVGSPQPISGGAKPSKSDGQAGPTNSVPHWKVAFQPSSAAKGQKELSDKDIRRDRVSQAK